MVFPGFEDVGFRFDGAAHDVVAEDLDRQAEGFAAALLLQRGEKINVTVELFGEFVALRRIRRTRPHSGHC